MSEVEFGYGIWYGSKNIYKEINLAKRIGFDYVELSLDVTWPKGLPVDEIKKALKETGIGIAIHAPWASISIGHPRDKIRKASIDVIKEAIDFSSKFDTIYLNFHPDARVEGQRLQEVKNLISKIGVESTKEIVDYASSYDIQTTIENSPHTRDFYASPTSYAKLLKIKNLKLCLDIGHAFKLALGHREKKDEKGILKKWLDFKRKILVIHLHDCAVTKSGIRDHLLIGKGVLNFEKIVAEIKKTSCHYIYPETKYRKPNVKATAEDLKKELEICKELGL